MKIPVFLSVTSDTYHQIIKNTVSKDHTLYLKENDKVIYQIAMKTFLEEFDPEFGRGEYRETIKVTEITTDDVNFFDKLNAYLFDSVTGKTSVFPIERDPDPIPHAIQLSVDFPLFSWDLSMNLASRQVV